MFSSFFSKPKPQQQQIAPMYNNDYNNDEMPNSANVEGEIIRRIPQQGEDPKATLTAVICTIMVGSSYDPLFSEVPQKPPEGRVSVFQLNYAILPTIFKKLKGGNVDASSVVKELFDDIAAVEPESVVFNFECCSGVSHSGGYHFPDKKVVFELLELLIHKKHMAMLSDFAMKALINEWSEKHLGPNPFVQIGEFDSSFDLAFVPSQLKECPSGQLVKVGELCEKGTATVTALSGTLAYTVNYKKADTKHYKVDVLTVATRLGSLDLSTTKHSLCTLKDYKGAAGHVLLTYPSGGMILCSCGHWIELVRLDVSMEGLLKVATDNYGATYSDQIAQELSNERAPERKAEIVQKYAKQFVTQSAPSKYSKQKW